MLKQRHKSKLRIKVRLAAAELRQIAGDFVLTSPRAKKAGFEYHVSSGNNSSWHFLDVPEEFACSVYDFLSGVRLLKKKGNAMVETNLEVAWAKS